MREYDDPHDDIPMLPTPRDEEAHKRIDVLEATTKSVANDAGCGVLAVFILGVIAIFFLVPHTCRTSNRISGIIERLDQMPRAGSR